MLERIFFHDILNTAGNLKNLSDLIAHIDEPAKKEDLLKLLSKLTNELVEEIQEQRQLSTAETGELIVNYSAIHTKELFESLISQFASHIKRPIKIAIAEDSKDISFSSDKTMLTRILKNMIKN